MTTATKLIASVLPILLVLGCGAHRKGNQASNPAVPAGEATPRVVTDLSSIAPTELVTAPAIQLPGASVAATPAPSGGEGSDTTYSNLNRLFLESPGTRQFAGTAASPGEERLLNAKAARFAPFSRALLHQVFVAAQDLERKTIAQEGLPADIGWAHISASMNKEGQVTELRLDKSSGSGVVDHLMLKACKTGLWAGNPPPEALTSDGDYKLRLEAHIKNFNRPTQERIWNFETKIGLALD